MSIDLTAEITRILGSTIDYQGHPRELVDDLERTVSALRRQEAKLRAGEYLVEALEAAWATQSDVMERAKALSDALAHWRKGR